MEMAQHWIYLFVALCQAVIIHSQSCLTPNNTPGQCIRIKTCEPLYAAFSKPSISQDTLVFLKLSACGVENNEPMVCCGAESTWKRRPTLSELRNLLYQIYKGDRNPIEQQSDLLPKSPFCGTTLNRKLAEGGATGLDEFPWHAMLEYRTADNTTVPICMGSLINEKYVLTAAQCVTGKVLHLVGTLETVRLGEYNTKTDPDCLVDPITNQEKCADPVQVIPVESSVYHPDYLAKERDKTTGRYKYRGLNDIALVRLSTPAKTSEFVKFLCLPTPETAPSVTGEKVIVAGWGETVSGLPSDVKIKTILPIFDFAECQKMVIGTTILGDGHLCAGGEHSNGACYGDGGGPLMRIIRRTWYCEGLVSFGRSCGLKGAPDVYTRVSNYMNWIKENVKP